MARSKRGFVLQQFLPGGITPSTASKKTGVVPESPMSLGSMVDPAVKALGGTSPASQLEAGTSKLNLAGGQALMPQAQATTGSKFGDLQKALGGINFGTVTGQPSSAASLLGSDAASTDWGSLMGYQGLGKDMISQALASLGISKPAPRIGTMASQSYGTDWMKSMGLI